MSAHTPGPWKAKLEDRLLCDGVQVSATDRDRIAYVQPDDTREIENGIIVECCSPEQMANARLIAAAPDLLAALEFVVASLDSYRDPLTNPLQRAADAKREARAAIAKARGR